MGKSLFKLLTDLGEYINERKKSYITNPEDFKLIKEVLGYEGKYDGMSHHLNINVQANCIVQYSKDRQRWQNNFIEYKNVCKENCYIRVRRHNRVEEATVVINIKPREILLSSKSREKEYDGTLLKCEEIIMQGDGFCQDECPEILVSGKIRIVGKSQNMFNYKFPESVIGNNYNIRKEFGILQILPRKNKYYVEIHMKSKEVIYNGQEHSVLGIEEDYIQISHNKYEIQAELKMLREINAGEYVYELIDKIKILDVDQQDVTEQFQIKIIPGFLKIKKRNICLSSNSLSKEYDGKTLEDKEVKITGDGLSDTDIMYAIAYGRQKIVGESENKIFYKFRNKDVEANYNIIKNNGTLTINKRKNPFIIMIKGKSATYIYDGKEHEINGLENEKFCINNQWFDIKGITSSAKLLHTGVLNTEINGKIIIYDSDNNDVSDQFNIHITPGKLKIEKRYIKLKSESKTIEYNGEYLEDHNIIIDEGNFCEDETPEFTEFRKIKYVGKCKNSFIFKFPKEVCKNDYKIDVDYGILKVINRKQKYQIEVQLKSKEVLYDGMVHSLFGIEQEKIEINENIYFLELDGEVKNAKDSGEYIYNSIKKIKVYDYNNQEVSEQFKINIIPGKLIIKKRNVMLISKSAIKEYDGIELINQKIEIEGEGFANNEGIKQIEFSGKQLLVGECLNAFSYVLQENTNINNYNILVTEGKLTVVNRKNPFEIEIEGENKKYFYDGNEKELSEYKNLLFKVNGAKFQIKGITNVVTGVEEGIYQQTNSQDVKVLDIFGNDVSKQFKVISKPGVLEIVHKSEIESKSISKDTVIENAWNRLWRKSNNFVVNKEEACDKGKAIHRNEIDLRYKKKLEPVEEIDVLAKLHNYIVKEFKTVTLLTEIEITDREYELLMFYLKRRYQEFEKYIKKPIVDVKLAVALVQIGIRNYENNYWPQVEKEIGVKKIDRVGQNWLGRSFYKTLDVLGKPLCKENEFVTNILMHCFITNLYANKFFDFLFQYYRIDLRRDISNLNQNNLHQLCNNIINLSSKRNNLLSDYVSMSVCAANEYCEKIISDSLRMIDNNFWDNNEDINCLLDRMKNLFDVWITKSEFYKDEKVNRKKFYSKKQFKKPYLMKTKYTEQFEIVFPSQNISQNIKSANSIADSKAKWVIVSTGGRKEEHVVYIYKDLEYQTKETSIFINPEEIFDGYLFELFYDDMLVHEFRWERHDEQFFLTNGKNISSKQLEEKLIIAFVKENSYIISEDIVYQGRSCGLKYYELNLHEGSVINTAKQCFYVGSLPKKGLLSVGKVKDVFVSKDGIEISLVVYKKSPILIIAVEQSYFSGTAIIINDHINKLSEIKSIYIGRKNENRIYSINLNDLYGEKEGYNKIIIDYPSSHRSIDKIEYYLLREFTYQFKSAPYIFENTGVLELNYKVLGEKINTNQKVSFNEIQFEINKLDNDILRIPIKYDESINFKVPILLTSWDRLNWNYKKMEDIWHNDLNNMLYIIFPTDSIAMCVEGKKSIISECYFNKLKDGIFDCDLTKLKSYFDAKKTMEQISIHWSKNKKILFKVIQKSILIEAQIYINKKTNEIVSKLDIIGKNSYFADLYCEDILLVEKELVVDNCVNFNVEVETAEYTIKIYEAENEFGFDDEYIYIGEKKQELVNPLDLIGGCMCIEQIIIQNDNALFINQDYRYYFFIEDMLEENKYSGILVATFHRAEVMYASKAIVKIIDINNPIYIRIERLTYENKKELFVYDRQKKAILDDSYKSNKKERYFWIDSQYDYCKVNYISSNIRNKNEGYNWLEEKENSKHRQFSIWKNKGE